MRTVWKYAFIVVIALIVSLLTMNIQTGAVASESETIGVQKKYGLPIDYLTTAPGLSRAQFSPIRFGLNTIVWMSLGSAIAMGLKKIRKARNPN